MNGKRIAIIGTGISGLTCGYHLADDHHITVYEANDYIGGHTHTVPVEREGELSLIDTGFIVFNERTYPNFINLMEELQVPCQPTQMSFSVRNDTIDLEYNGHTISTLFAQNRNLLRPFFWKMILEIIRFNKDVKTAADNSEELTIGDYLESSRYSKLFRENYILPMISAIWSMGLQKSLELPLLFFVRFFENHGLLQLSNRPQWYTISGGSSSYIAPLTQKFKDKILLSTPVHQVERQDTGVAVISKERREMYDEVIFACHGDQALSLLKQPSNLERALLANFNFSENRVILHTDTSHLPRRSRAWASWNYRMVDAAQEQTVLTYNMNILQNLQKKHTYLVTLNQEIAEHHILDTFAYSHPIFTRESLRSQEQWDLISGVDRIHYCGAYWFNGFHEDGVKSGLRVVSKLRGKP